MSMKFIFIENLSVHNHFYQKNKQPQMNYHIECPYCHYDFKSDGDLENHWNNSNSNYEQVNNKRSSNIENSLGTMREDIDEVNTRLSNIENSLGTMREDIDEINTRLSNIDNSLGKMVNYLGLMNEGIVKKDIEKKIFSSESYRKFYNK